MTEWRLLKGWRSEELRVRLERLRSAPLNFSGAEEELTGERGWHHYHSEAIIAREAGGDDCFRRARVALSNYQFSDPAIVVAHFDPDGGLLGRRILLDADRARRWEHGGNCDDRPRRDGRCLCRVGW